MSEIGGVNKGAPSDPQVAEQLRVVEAEVGHLKQLLKEKEEHTMLQNEHVKSSRPRQPP